MRISDWSSDVCSSDLRRRMHRVAAEIAEEVGVLFEDRDGHAGARELEARDHARGTAADDDNRVNVSHINLRSCRAKSRHREVVRSRWRSEEHTSELQSLMRISYAVFCLKKKKKKQDITNHEY